MKDFLLCVLILGGIGLQVVALFFLIRGDREHRRRMAAQDAHFEEVRRAWLRALTGQEEEP